jgi:hypothetical protein
MRKWRLLPIFVVSGAVCFAAIMSRMSVEAVLLWTGWAMVLTVLVSLGMYRIMLSFYDHRARVFGIPATHPVYQWFLHQETMVDRIGIPLTILEILYTVAVGAFIISELIDAAIRKMLPILAPYW